MFVEIFDQAIEKIRSETLVKTTIEIIFERIIVVNHCYSVVIALLYRCYSVVIVLLSVVIALFSIVIALLSAVKRCLALLSVVLALF